MRQYFVASLIREGILGGGITADDEGLTYKTGKVTVSPQLKHIEIKYRDIQSYSQKWILFFPVFSLALKNGESYRFIIFNPVRFDGLMREKVGS